MIVLKEDEWAKRKIISPDLTDGAFDTLRRVARYYIDEGCHTKSEIRDLLDGFMFRCDPAISLVKWSDTLDAALKAATKRDAVDIDYVPICEDEMRTIQAFKGKQVQRLAFTLLCLAKYWDGVNHSQNHWVYTSDSDIMKMANISTSLKRQSLLYNQMYEIGMIDFSKRVDNNNVKVNFVSDGKIAHKISDFRNLGYQYKMITGDINYIRCRRCGIVVRKNTTSKDGLVHAGRDQLYCTDCMNALRVQRRVNRVMSQNSSDKNSALTVLTPA